MINFPFGTKFCSLAMSMAYPQTKFEESLVNIYLSYISEIKWQQKDTHRDDKRYNITFYFILNSEFNAYLKQIKAILSTVKKYSIFSLVTNTIYTFHSSEPRLFRQFRA